MQLRTVLVLLVVPATGAVASCGSSADPVVAVAEPAVSAVAEGVAAVDTAGALACDGERRALELAIDAYAVLEGDPPARESDLVPDWLREESALFDVVDGAVTPAAGSPCQ